MSGGPDSEYLNMSGGPDSEPLNMSGGPDSEPLNMSGGSDSEPLNMSGGPDSEPLNMSGGPDSEPLNMSGGPDSEPLNMSGGPDNNIHHTNLSGPSVHEHDEVASEIESPPTADCDKDEDKASSPKSTGVWTSGLSFSKTLQAGSKLSKKFGNASRFVVSSHMWMHTIPTRDCDVLVTFPAKTDNDVLMWLLSRLRTRTPELVTHVRHHSNTGVYGFYLTATYESLLRVADELAIKKPLKTQYGGGMKEFVYEDQDYFEGVEDAATFLSSQERQSAVRHVLYNMRATEGDVLHKTRFLEGQPIVPYLVSKSVIQQVLPLHCSEDLRSLRSDWVQAFFRFQPLDKICDYFGVKIAMYFTYLGHYTGALTFPTILGLILWFIDGTYNQTADDVCFVVFAFFNVIWATLYLENWKRTSAKMAYTWGTLDKEDELLTDPRPLFHGNLSRSPVTGRLVPTYPAWKRHLFRYFVTVPVIAVCLCVVFAIMWCIFELQDWVNVKIKLEDIPSFCKFLPKILLALSIGILDEIYKKIAYWLNAKKKKVPTATLR